MDKDEFDYRYELLLKEIELLQKRIGDFDTLQFNIKSWSITLFSGFVFLALKEKTKIFVGFGGITVILFWILDSIYRKFQRDHVLRYDIIEEFLRSPEFSKAVKTRKFEDFYVLDVIARVSVKRPQSTFNLIKTSSLSFPTSILYILMLLLSSIIYLWMLYVKL